MKEMEMWFEQEHQQLLQRGLLVHYVATTLHILISHNSAHLTDVAVIVFYYVFSSETNK